MQFDTLRVFIFHVYVVTNENPTGDANSAEFVQEWPQGGRSRRKPSQHAKNAIKDPPNARFFHESPVTFNPLATPLAILSSRRCRASVLSLNSESPRRNSTAVLWMIPNPLARFGGCSLGQYRFPVGFL